MKRTSGVLVLVFLSVWLIGRVQTVSAQSAANDFQKVDAYITEAMHRLPIKGMALAIVKGDQILYMQGYGTANAQGDPATPQTPWPMGSVTKSFTALAIRQLALAGKINLDAPLQTYLPEFRLADQQAASAITIQQLLDHTSGISQQEGEAPYLNSPGNTFEEDLKALARYRPAHPPGEHYEYSNWNYVLLANVVARASRQSYVEYVQQNILAPLGMKSSTFADFHAIPHAATGNLITFGFPVAYDEKFVPAMVGAGYLTSTAKDMAHFLSLSLGEGVYHGAKLLPASGVGWYGTMWEWHPVPATSDLNLGLSGGHNSISTTCLFYPLQDMGVVLLLNTRLDGIPPGISSYEIAQGIGNLVTRSTTMPPPYTKFIATWVGVDGLLLLCIAAILWQAFRLKSWMQQYLGGKLLALAWIGILLDLLACILILVFPRLANTQWRILFFYRPDFAIPLFLIGVCLGALGLTKIILSTGWIPSGRRNLPG